MDNSDTFFHILARRGEGTSCSKEAKRGYRMDYFLLREDWSHNMNKS